MHYSQGGGLPPGAAVGGPWPVLLLGGCMGCHSNTATDTIKTGNIPVVWNTAGGTQDPGTSNSWAVTANMNLAGGNFYYVVFGPDHPKGHNIDGMVVQDTNLQNNPPGYNSTYDPATTKWSITYQLTCAGSNGCHGNRDVARASYANGFSASFAGIKGAHHGDDTPPLDGTTTAKSYRFLGSAALSAYSVLGREDANWQQSADVNDHNEYQGALTQGTINTISYLCGHCHGNFHASGSSGIGTASPWLRHPTDTDVIAKGGEYTNYNNVIGGNAYSLGVPVGYVGAIPGAPRATVTSGDSPVICLSCHRAHASPYFKMMRWDYKSTTLSTSLSGCNVCHTSKN